MSRPIKIRKETRQWFWENDPTIGQQAGYTYDQFYQKFHYLLYQKVDIKYLKQVVLKDIELEDEEEKEFR